jgi:hypothetical protein
MGEAIDCLEHQLAALAGLRKVAARQLEKAPAASEKSQVAGADIAQLEERIRDVAAALDVLGGNPEPHDEPGRFAAAAGDPVDRQTAGAGIEPEI